MFVFKGTLFLLSETKLLVPFVPLTVVRASGERVEAGLTVGLTRSC
jgi:hypothetical protein